MTYMNSIVFKNSFENFKIMFQNHHENHDYLQNIDPNHISDSLWEPYRPQKTKNDHANVHSQ